jgi:UDP-N-acetylglucosamine 2-epimerase (non-hydrolysing)
VVGSPPARTRTITSPLLEREFPVLPFDCACHREQTKASDELELKMEKKHIRITAVVGTRPEAIKLAPVIWAARERKEQFHMSVVRTGQHRELLDPLMEELNLKADADLEVMKPNQELSYVLAESVRGLSEFIVRNRADWVLVQGDTTSAFAGALAGFYNSKRVGHVEAGLRTGVSRNPFPEEANRSLIARLADLHFAPTEQARLNLLKESIASEQILVTGNTVVDTMLGQLSRSSASERYQRHENYIIVTVHRRENHGLGLENICDAMILLLEQISDISAVIPMHPNPNVRDVLMRRLSSHPRVFLRQPIGYNEFVHLLSRALLVLTDSGGVQEECAAIGKPVVVLRAFTERSEATEAGVSVVVGTDPCQIIGEAHRLINKARAGGRELRFSTIFGDGNASTRILDKLSSIPRLSE